MGSAIESIDGFRVREGDTLFVSFPEVKFPIPGVPYSSLSVGNISYTRALKPGDNVQVEYDRIYDFLKRMAERDGKEKARAWSEEFGGSR